MLFLFVIFSDPPLLQPSPYSTSLPVRPLPLLQPYPYYASLPIPSLPLLQPYPYSAPSPIPPLPLFHPSPYSTPPPIPPSPYYTLPLFQPLLFTTNLFTRYTKCFVVHSFIYFILFPFYFHFIEWYFEQDEQTKLSKIEERRIQ